MLEGTAREELDRGRRVLDELEMRIARRLPEWTARGPEDPARVILEALALSVAESRETIARLPEELMARLLAELGEEARWPEPARGAVVLVPRPDLSRAVRVPGGTGVTSSRPAAPLESGVSPWRPRFETAGEGWLSPARLRRALVCEDHRQAELPVARAPGDRAERRAAVPLFSSSTLDRHVYFGDEAWTLLLEKRDEIVLEWSGIPSFALEGRWHYSVRGGWRRLPVELEETVDARGSRILRVRVLGPLPDLAPCRLQGTRSPWIRLSLEGPKRIQWTPPRIAWLPSRGGIESEDAPNDGSGALFTTPRPIARVFSNAGERWEDHSFAETARVNAARPTEGWFPSVYLGWDRPLPASLYWDSAGSATPAPDTPAMLEWGYSSGRGFRVFEPHDRTGSFSRSGSLSWGLLEGWGARDLFGERLFWIRARWVAGSYLDPPAVRWLHPGGVEVVEGRTLRNVPVDLRFEPAGKTTFFPPPADGDWEPFDVLEVEGADGVWRPFERVAGAPAEEECRLRRRPGGEVELEIGRELSGSVRARVPALRAGIGLAGSLAVEPLDALEAEIEGLAGIAELSSPAGGREGETLEDVARRVRATWALGFRAVTAEDFRRLALELDPHIARAEALSVPERPAEVLVVVFPRPPCEAGKISPPRLERLERLLQERAPLGTVVRVVEPCYVPCRLELSSDGDPAGRDALAAALEAGLRSFADPLSGGEDRCGYPLGRSLRQDDVESIMASVLNGRSGLQAQLSTTTGLRDEGSTAGVSPLVFPLIEGSRFERGTHRVPGQGGE